MTPQQYDIERHSPSKLAEAYRVAAETAECNPYLPEDERAKRAQHYREQAREFESRISHTEVTS